MNKNKDVYLLPTIMTFAFLSLCFLISTDFGNKYGGYINNREFKEILLYSSITIFISGIVFVGTKDKRNTIGQMTKSTINQQINNKMKSEISEYILIIKGLGDEELGIAVLAALTLRKEILTSSGIELMDPLIALQQNPDLTITFSKKHEEFTAQKLPHLTVPYTVWIHTLRSVSNPVIRTLGRQMWKELSRGFNHIEGKKEHYRWIYGVEPSSELAGQFPLGLDPSDIEKNDVVAKVQLTPEDKEIKLQEYIELHKKGLITKEALTNLQVELLSKKNQ